MSGHYYLFDTGPLLAFAAVKGGPTLLKGRYAGSAGIITDVLSELRGLQRNQNQQVAAAATTASRSYKWLDEFVIDDEEGLREVQRLQVRLQTYKKRGRLQNAEIRRQDWGECATLVLAQRDVAFDLKVVVANEDAARDMASDMGIATICAVDILKALVRDGVKTPKQAYAIYRDVSAKGIDLGDVVRTPQDLQ